MRARWLLALLLAGLVGGGLWWRRRQEALLLEPDPEDEEATRQMEEELQQRAEQEAQEAEQPLPEEAPGPAPKASGKVRPEVVERLKQYDSLFTEAAQDSGIPPSWLKGVAAAESGGNATSGQGASGYKGLLQAERSADQLDPATSIKAGADKLGRFKQSLASHLGADFEQLAPLEQLRVLATAYNAGPATVYKALDYARAAGDVARWRDPEFYTKALIYYGAYSTKAYAPKGTEQAAIDDAEKWRKQSARKDLALEDLRSQGAPELVLKAVEEKQAHTAPYLDKIVSYAQFFDSLPQPQAVA